MRKPLDKANIYEVELQSHKIPVNIEKQREGYVTFGEDNLYPNYLIELYNRSAKHNAIINSKVTYVYGKGLEMTVQDARLQELFDSVNRWQTLNEFTYQLVTDLELYNGTAIEIIWNRSGTSYEMKVLEFKNVRSNVDGSMFYYSPQWALYSTPDIIEYPAFDINNRKGRQIFYYKVYRPGCKVYPIVNYIGCIPYIETDIEISNYHLNNIKNGFWGGKVITFIAQQPTKEEMQAISRQFRYTKTGTDNAGKFVLNFVPNKESAPLIESLEPEDSDTKFEILNKTVLQEIFVGHQITSPMLMGVRVEGQLGGRTEMLDAYELFKNTYVNGRQQIAEKIINFHAENLTGIKGAYRLIPTEPIANNEQPKPQAAPQETQQSEIVVNDSLKNLTGRQMQNVMRITRKYSNGSLTYEQAVTMLKGGYGLTTEDIDSMLGETEEFSSQQNLNEYLNVYQSFGGPGSGPNPGGGSEEDSSGNSSNGSISDKDLKNASKEIKNTDFSPDSINALKSYAGAEYAFMNSNLRKGGVATEKDNLLSELLTKAPKIKGESYRGLSFGTEDELNNFIGSIKVGSTLKDNGFMSTSANKSFVEERFTGKNTNKKGAVIFSMSGKNGVYVQPLIKQKSNEQEILFNRGSSHKITSIESLVSGEKIIYNIKTEEI